MTEPINCALCGAEVEFLVGFGRDTYFQRSPDGEYVLRPGSDVLSLWGAADINDLIAGERRHEWPRYEEHQYVCPALVERRNECALSIKQQWEAIFPLPDPIQTDRTTGWRWWKR